VFSHIGFKKKAEDMMDEKRTITTRATICSEIKFPIHTGYFEIKVGTE